jgi:hypothetical protein
LGKRSIAENTIHPPQSNRLARGEVTAAPAGAKKARLIGSQLTPSKRKKSPIAK